MSKRIVYGKNNEDMSEAATDVFNYYYDLANHH
jgi:hypothetical protein